jgi:hypothetical protein
MAFDQPENIQPWLFLLLSNGLTAIDHAATTEQPLLSGITVAKLSGSQPVTFSYAAQPAEKLVFSVQSLSKQSLEAELKDGAGNSLAKNATAPKGGATILSYDATAQTDLKLVVTSTNSTAEGVIQVALKSSLGISGCNLNTTGNGTTTTNATIPTPTPTKPAVVTAAANKLATAGFSAAGLLLAALFL